MNDLSKLLASWEPEIPELPAFRRNVWQRIAVSEKRSKSGIVLWFESILILIGRPRIAVVAACATVVLGVAVGGNLSVRGDADAYLRSVNPYAQIASR